MPKQDGDVPIIACQDGRMWIVTDLNNTQVRIWVLE